MKKTAILCSLVLAVVNCNNPSSTTPTEVAAETWDITEPQTTNHADITLKKAGNGAITCTGNWYYEFIGSEVTCIIMQGSVQKDSTHLSITCSGTASYPPDETGYVESSAFTLNMSGRFSGGSASGDWSISFSDPEWNAWAPDGVFSGQLKSGSGITG